MVYVPIFGGAIFGRGAGSQRNAKKRCSDLLDLNVIRIIYF